METLDKEKIRRAYLKARKLNLSHSVQQDLTSKLQPSQQTQQEVNVAERQVSVESKVQEKFNSDFESKAKEWLFLLKNEKKYLKSTKFFLENASSILSSLNSLNVDETKELFELLLSSVHKPFELLKLTPFGRLLAKSKNEEDLFSNLSHFVEARSKDFSREDILVLSLFLSDPHVWVLREPGSWKKLSQWILKYSKILPEVTQPLQIFYKNRFTLYEMPLQKALWAPVLDIQENINLRGYAYFHSFLAHELLSEDLLWKAWACFENEKQQWMGLLKWLQSQAHLSIYSEIPLIKMKQEYFPITYSPESLKCDLIQDHIQKFGVPKNKILQNSLLEFIKNEDQLEFQCKFLFQLSALRGLTDEELIDLEGLAKQSENTTLLDHIHRLQFIHSKVHWPLKEFSKKSDRYNPTPVPEEKTIPFCLFDFTTFEKKFMSSYIRLAPLVHYYNNKNSKDYRVLRTVEWLFDPSLRKLQTFYKKNLVKPLAPIIIKKNNYNSAIRSEIPLFFSKIPDNDFGKILAGISQILALNHFEDILNTLQVNSKSISNQEIANWLSSADKDIKMNWHQLQSSSLHFSIEAITKLLRRFSLRFASLACRDLNLSLWSLSQENVPKELYCELESWLLHSSMK